jgi:hypothetical protein
MVTKSILVNLAHLQIKLLMLIVQLQQDKFIMVVRILLGILEITPSVVAHLNFQPAQPI